VGFFSAYFIKYIKRQLQTAEVKKVSCVCQKCKKSNYEYHNIIIMISLYGQSSQEEYVFWSSKSQIRVCIMHYLIGLSEIWGC